MSAQGLSSLQEEARQIIQEMEKQELELFIKIERAAGKNRLVLGMGPFPVILFPCWSVVPCVFVGESMTT